jgi:hypothetical protein
VLSKRARYTIPVNPTTGLEIVAAGNKPRRIVAPDVGAKMIAAHTLEDRALRGTAFLAGLRNGELQALELEDVELFEQGRWGLIHVRRGWDKVEGAVETKSAAGARTIPVGSSTSSSTSTCSGSGGAPGRGRHPAGATRPLPRPRRQLDGRAVHASTRSPVPRRRAGARRLPAPGRHREPDGWRASRHRAAMTDLVKFAGVVLAFLLLAFGAVGAFILGLKLVSCA